MRKGASYIAGGLLFSLTAALTFAAGVYATEDAAKSPSSSSSGAQRLSGDTSLIVKVRDLSELQQHVVDGDKSALAEQLATARTIAQELAGKPASAWQSPRDLRAIIKFVLSGGDPTTLSNLISSASIPEGELPLARGVLAYSRGDKTQAAKLLDAVEHRLLGPSLAGHVALVKAVVASQSSASDALALCREALLLSPGTHIEEAALRLLISLAAASGDATAVKRAHSRHLLRFPNSLYARDIDARASAIRVASIDAPAIDLDATAALSELIPSARRRAFFAQLAEVGLRAGKPKIAIRAARIALLPPHSPPESDAETTATLLAIEGAALVLSGDRKDGLQRLVEARAAGPSAAIFDLIAEAQSLVGMIEAPPTQSGRLTRADAAPSVISPGPSPAPSPKTEKRASAMAPYEAVLSRSQAAFSSADKLIEQASK